MEIVRNIYIREEYIFSSWPNADELIALRTCGFEFKDGRWFRTERHLQSLEHHEFLMRIEAKSS